MRKNFIETGNILMSAIDARNMKKEKSIKALGEDQITLLKNIHDLIRKIENTL